MKQINNTVAMRGYTPVKSLQSLTQRTVQRFLFVMSLILIASPLQAQDAVFGGGPTPLPVDAAFSAEIVEVSADGLQVSFAIAEGYYLYQKRFSFESDDSNVLVGAPSYPTALTHEDDYFGKSNIFRDELNIALPVENTNGAQSFNLTVGFQGCADMGLCYPPTLRSFKVDLPVQSTTLKNNAIASSGLLASSTASSSDIQDLFKKKISFGNNTQDEPLLHPSEAFIPSLVDAADGQITVQWLIQPGYYLYRDKIKAELIDTDKASVNGIDIDRGKMQHDEFFGDVEVLREVPTARISVNSAAALSDVNMELYYQGCADVGVCFPPESVTIPVLFTNSIEAVDTNTSASASASASAIVMASNDSATVTPKKVLPVSEQDKLSKLLESGNLGLIALAFYIAGLLLAFTACVYPMIPILSSLIVGQGESIGPAKAFSLSAVYVMSMASVFAVLGILVGLSGYNIQPLFQNPWVLTAFAALFVILALSMFGLFQLQMPSALQAKVNDLSNKQSSGTYSGVAVMGVLSALIVGPCVTPPLVAALAYIAKTGDATIGGIALFAIGIGMGTPLLFIGTSLGKWMPKAGGWMDTTQRFFGVILIAVAIYMLSRFLPGGVIMMMYAMLALFAGVFFGGTDRIDSESRGTQRLAKAFGLTLIIYGAVLMVGALSGNKSMLSPLKGIGGQQTSQEGQADSEHITFQRVKTEAELDNALAQAKAQGRPVLFDFYADWCVSCKEMEAFTFTDSRVKEQLVDAVFLQADVTKNDAADKALLKRFSLFGPPAIMLYDRDGVELTAGRVVGFMPADKFSEHLKAYLN